MMLELGLMQNKKDGASIKSPSNWPALTTKILLTPGGHYLLLFDSIETTPALPVISSINWKQIAPGVPVKIEPLPTITALLAFPQSRNF